MRNIIHPNLHQFLTIQNQALDLVVSNEPLEACLTQICTLLEAALLNNNIIVGISLCHGDQLEHITCPTLPELCQALGALSTDGSLKCQTTESILNNQKVISQTEQNDIHWPGFQQFIKTHDIHTCQSWPIASEHKNILGSLDIYVKNKAQLNDIELPIIAHFAQFTAVTIKKHHTQEQQQELIQSIQDSNLRMKAVSHLIPDLLFVMNKNGTFESFVGGNRNLLLMEESAFIGKKYQDLLPDEVSQAITEGFDQALESNQTQVVNYSLEIPIGKTQFEARIIPAEKDRNTLERRLLMMVRDVTDQYKDKKQIEKLAYTDALTRLANRSLLMGRLEEKITFVAENKLCGALIFLDLDDFKKINDSLGHSVGDEFLIMIGLRLKQATPASATLARIGGDEFVILLEDLSVDEAEITEFATALANKLIKHFDKSFFYNQVEYHIGCSMGICTFDGQHAKTADQVLQQADMCMYQAKKSGGHQLILFDKELTDTSAQRFRIESEIQKGLKNDSFKAYFQPQYDQSGQIIAAEALIRWKKPNGQTIQPNDFIPVAENSGLINKLQQVVLNDACHLIKQIDQINGHSKFTVSINISPNQFRTDLGNMLLTTATTHDLDACRFKLEITESVLLERSHVVKEQIDTIQSMGFQLSIDDFGMGYSSLAYLYDLPIQELKIDKAFIEQQTQNTKQRAIVEAITTMATALDLDVILEGVETEQQHELLKGLKYTALQGFLFSKPLSSSDFTALFHQQA